MQGVSARDLSTFDIERHEAALDWLNAPAHTAIVEAITTQQSGWRQRARQLQVCTAHLDRFVAALHKLAVLAETPLQRNAHKTQRRRLIALLAKLDDESLSRYCVKYNVYKASFGSDHAMLLEALADEMAP